MVASIAPQHTALGLVPTFQAALAAGDTYPAAGSPVLQVKNSGPGPVTVTIAAITACSQGFLHPLSFAVAANTAVPFEYGPVGTLNYQDLSANVEVSYSTTVQPPPAAPTLAIGAGGTPNGTYRCQCTFVNAGGESTGSVEVVITVVNQQINWSAITLGPAGTTARNLYRTVAEAAQDSATLTEQARVDVSTSIASGDRATEAESASVVQNLATGQARFVATLADNVTTTYTDNVTDSALGVGIPLVNRANVVQVAVTQA